MPREPTRRLFFALWPQEAARLALIAATRDVVLGWGGRPVAPQNLHVTVAFLGRVSEQRLAQLSGLGERIARDLEPQPLRITFDAIECWKKARLICVTASEPPRAVLAVVSALQSELLARGFAPDLKPFRAHATLARQAELPARVQPITPVSWQFCELSLVESRTDPQGSVYRVIESFPWRDSPL